MDHRKARLSGWLNVNGVQNVAKEAEEFEKRAREARKRLQEEARMVQMNLAKRRERNDKSMAEARKERDDLENERQKVEVRMAALREAKKRNEADKQVNSALIKGLVEEHYKIQHELAAIVSIVPELNEKPSKIDETYEHWPEELSDHSDEENEAEGVSDDDVSEYDELEDEHVTSELETKNTQSMLSPESVTFSWSSANNNNNRGSLAKRTSGHSKHSVRPSVPDISPILPRLSTRCRTSCTSVRTALPDLDESVELVELDNTVVELLDKSAAELLDSLATAAVASDTSIHTACESVNVKRAAQMFSRRMQK